MKKSMLAVAIFTMGIFGTNLMAQDAPEADRHNPGGFGFKGGIGITTLSFGDNEDPNEDWDNQNNRIKVGGMVGLSYEWRMGNIVGLDLEALYANKGAQQKWESDENDDFVSLKTNLHTIDVPLSLKIYPGIDNFNIYFGPYASFIAGASAKLTSRIDGERNTDKGESWFKDEAEDPDGDTYLNRFDAGVNVGLEFISNGGFGVGARFQKGFVDLTNDEYSISRQVVEGPEGVPTILIGDNKRVTNTGFQVYAIVRL